MHLGKRVYSLFLFFLVSIVGGLLVAGLFVPAAAAVSASGSLVADGIDSLPAELATPPQAERSKLLAADGTVIAYWYNENRVYEPLDKIAPIMQQAQVAIEDHRFYEHGAIDLTGTLRALVSNAQGISQGGSGLTQQLVRLIQVENAVENNDPQARMLATENTLSRKVREMRYAIAMERKYTKDQILEMYLNIAYYGDGAYGVEAAAHHFFDTSAAKLTLPQAAMLAGLVQNPYALDPVKHPQMAIERRNTVINRMAELKIISADEAAAAKATTFDQSKVRDSLMGCANSKYPFICDYAKRELEQHTPSLGDTEAERHNLLFRGGLTITTSLDLKVQKAAQKAVSEKVAAKDPAIAVTTLVEPGTGKILAMAQSRPDMASGKKPKDGTSGYNYAVEKNMGGTDGFPAGSTFKAFVAAAALNEGTGADISFDAVSPYHATGKPFETCNGTQIQTTKWDPGNATGRGAGYINMFQGAKQSVNTYFIQLEMRIGLCPVVQMAKTLGLTQVNGLDIMDPKNQVPAFTLGTMTVPPLTMAAAYATFGARGVHCDPVIVTSIKSANGNKFKAPSANCKQVISKDLADAMNDVLQGPYNGGTATSAKVPGVQMAGKTGTLNNYKAVWTMGYTPTLAAASMISYDPGPKFKKYWNAHSRYLGGIVLPESHSYIGGSSGGDAGASLLKPTFIAALKTHDTKNFTDPPASILQGHRVDVPGCVGRGESSCKAILEDAGFTTSTTRVFSDTAPVGTVISTMPSGTASIYSQILLTVSKGPDPAKPPEPPDGKSGSGSAGAKPAGNAGSGGAPANGPVKR